MYPKSFAGERDKTMIEFSAVNNSLFFFAANTYSGKIGDKSRLHPKSPKSDTGWVLEQRFSLNLRSLPAASSPAESLFRRVGSPCGQVLGGRSLGPLVKTRDFGMTPQRRRNLKLSHYADLMSGLFFPARVRRK